MRKTEIRLQIELDDQNVPTTITWHADDAPADTVPDTRCFALSIWEADTNQTLNINLWTQKMMMGEMKKFYLQTVAGLTETLFSATGDEVSYKEMNRTLENMAQRFIKEERDGSL